MAYLGKLLDLACDEAKRRVAEFDAFAKEASNSYAATTLVEALVDHYGLDDIAQLIDQHKEAAL